MEPFEIEIKFHLTDPDQLRTGMGDIGAVRVSDPIFEYNACYDIDEDRLLKKDCLLRLRQDQATTLTFKSPPTQASRQFKIFRELEARVDNFDNMDAILNALGYFRRQVYEKWREHWQIADASVCLDTMPYGHFLEIEGPRDQIREIASQLGLDWQRRILSSYLEMFSVLRTQAGLTFTDVTFENFTPHDIDFADHCHLFEARGADGR